MLDVFFTVDVEIWCDGWKDIDDRFAASFRKYVYGPTPQGNHALPYTLRVLADHGLAGVFFVEPLFARRFGIEPLAEIVGLLREAGQEVQLHMHTEWVDEALEPLLARIDAKRQFLRCFSRAEQIALIATGKDLLAKAGEPRIRAFRAGSFGFNLDTLGALAANEIPFDTSYNASTSGLTSGVMPGVVITDALACEDGVYEYPLTVFDDTTGSLRHVQLTACSYRELEGLLWQALEKERKCFVILSHNFELLNESKTRPDSIVVQRYRKLCAFLDKNRDSFRVRGFASLMAPARTASLQPQPLTSPLWKTAERVLQQAYRRVYG